MANEFGIIPPDYHLAELNVWGTAKVLIDPDEFCQECEHFIPGHYTNCPTRVTIPHPPTWPGYIDNRKRGI